MVAFLGDLGVGAEGVVEAGADTLDAVTRQRLLHHGIMPGVPVKVLQRTSGGGLLIAVGRTRVAVDPAVASALPVRTGGAG